MKRMTGRRTCEKCGASYHVDAAPPKQEGVCDKCGTELIIRADDKPETVASRLVTYHETTEPLKDYYAARGVLKSVVNQGSIPAMTAAIMEVLE